MSSSIIRPKWWQLYLSLPLLFVLFVLDARFKISARGHQAVQIGILLIIYGLVNLWLKVNASALSKMDQRQYYRTNTMIRVPIAQLPDADADVQRRPTLELSGLEVKGVLSDTFDVE